MRKNRKRSMKMSVLASRTLHLGSVLLVLFVAVIVNLLANSSCNQMMKVLGDKERLLSQIEDDLTRETARWDAMKTPGNIRYMLRKHGLKMDAPDVKLQCVRMGADGMPIPSPAVARARAELANGRIAAVTGKKLVRR